ncbi:MAG: zinc-binding dehydrogenase, partial [Nitrososphaerota archaeon]
YSDKSNKIEKVIDIEIKKPEIKIDLNLIELKDNKKEIYFNEREFKLNYLLKSSHEIKNLSPNLKLYHKGRELNKDDFEFEINPNYKEKLESNEEIKIEIKIKLKDNFINYLEKEILKLTNGNGSDIVIVAVGSPKAQQDALKIVRRGGRINFFAGLPSKEAVPLDTNVIHYKQITVLGTSMSTPYEFKKTLDIVSSKLIDVKPLITHRLKLIEGLKGFEMATKLESLKVMLYP